MAQPWLSPGTVCFLPVLLSGGLELKNQRLPAWTSYRPPPGLGPRCLPSLELTLPSWGGMVELFPLAPSWLALSKLEISQEGQIPSPHSYFRMRALRLREGSLPIALLPTSYHLQILGPREHGCFLLGGQPLLTSGGVVRPQSIP